MAHAYALPAEPMPDPSGFTVEDWLALPEFKQRVELFDGSYLVSPLASFAHQVCVGRLLLVLAAAAPPDLEVLPGANLVCADQGLIPDLLVVDTEAVPVGAAAVNAESVLLVVEVVSPGKNNRLRDYEHKPEDYARGGIPTFLRVELAGVHAPVVEVLTLADGKYVRTALVSAGETLELKEPFPVAFDPAVLAGRRES